MKTTDNQQEVFDVVDEHDHVIGQATRGQCHVDKSLIHRSVSIGIFNDKDEILLQQRSLTKDTEPGYWDISCGGHVLAGYTYEETAPRELREELGISLPLTLLKIHLTRLSHETEFSAVFKGFYNGPFKIHRQEIIQIQFYSPSKLGKLVTSGKIRLTEQVTINLRKVFKILP